MNKTDFWYNVRRKLHQFGRAVRQVCATVRRGVQKGWHKLRKNWQKCTRNFLKRFTKWIDPKLEPYRRHNASSKIASDELLVPQTLEEFVKMIKKMPKNVLTARERGVIATVMAFPERKVSEVMLPKNEITYVKEDEVLGPLTLDRLYRSGFAHFPVINARREIVGLLHTTALNSLEVREASLASEILDKNVCYVRDDYTLYQALAAFYRTNCYFFLVVDPFERIVGMLTYQMLVDLLLGDAPQDDFERDNDRTAVAKRKM